MTGDDEIFADALAQPPAARADWLARACAGDPARRARIETLLAAYTRAGGAFLNPARAQPAPAGEQPGMRLGRYHLLEKIGEGGCGVVWMAEQSEPVRRRVALKVIKLGMDTQAVIARFEAERQALALMDHPNIAKVHDAGTTDTGRPYFVMELVRGIPITRFCDEENLPTAQRLDLFVQVCGALQHAHQKGIIHRDIKPSNILVTRHDDRAVPVVIDFGIAKATQGRLTDRTLFTAFEQFMGTPAYMSPEQSEFNALDVDARSDVYSLGVLLYELLTGRPPFDPHALVSAGLDEVRRIIREVEPPRPSTRWNTLQEAERTALARQRGLAPAQLSTLMRGDLDWIVMKALEKNRARRYDSASAFGADVQRFLAHQPVIARPPSAGYLLGKLVRRHRLAVAAAAAVALVLVAGVVASTWQALRATRAEQAAIRGAQAATRAEQEQRRLREVAQQAQTAEAALRTQAEAERVAARRRAYASDMHLLQQALATDNLGRARELLARQRPQPGEQDFRGWEWRYLWQLCRSDASSVLTSEPMPEARLAVSPDGEWLATAQSLPDRVILWNVQTKQPTPVPLPENCTWPVVAFVPHQPWLVIGWQIGRDFRSQRGHLRVWNYATQQVVKDQGIFYGPNQLTVTADGKTLISLHSGSGYVNVWRLPEIDRFQRHQYGLPHATTRNLNLAAWNDARNRAIVVEDYTEQKISNVVSSQETPVRTKWKTPTGQGRVTSLAFSPDDKLLAAARADPASSITLFEAETGREVGTLKGHGSYATAMVFWPDGRTLATAAVDQTIRIWDVEKRTLRRTLRGHTRPVTNLVLLPDNTTLVSSAGDGAVHFWDTTVTPPPSYFRSEAQLPRWYFTADSQAVVTSDNGRVTRFGGPEFRTRTRWGGPEPTALMCLANDAPLYAVWMVDLRTNKDRIKRGDPCVVQIWNYERGERVCEIRMPGEAANPFAFTEHGKKLLIEILDQDVARRTVQEWDVSTGEKLRTWPRSTTQALAVVSDDGRMMLSRPTNVIGQYPFNYDGELAIPHDAPCSLIDLATGAERMLPDVQAGFKTARFSADGRFFVAPVGPSISIWETQKFEKVRSITDTGSVQVPQAALFSPDGGRVVSLAGGRDAVRFWDPLSGEPVFTLAVPGAELQWAWFSPDGNTLGAGVGTVHFWRAPSWAEIEAAEREKK